VDLVRRFLAVGIRCSYASLVVDPSDAWSLVAGHFPNSCCDIVIPYCGKINRRHCEKRDRAANATAIVSGPNAAGRAAIGRSVSDSRTLTALRIGQHLVKTGDSWALDIPAADTKTRRALDFPVSPEISARIDLYLEQFRSRIPGADKHTGLWPSNKSRPMCANGIYLAVRKRTKTALGFGVNLHRFRHAAASFWSSQDPVNVRGVKDVLGQASFGTTEKHYIMAQSRLAGRALAHAINAVRKAS
jgi:hypothetical protein